ncbi:MAG: hypothetical protein MI924_37305 [Chloroflexales bacterium]|nr:hypothetical protein [Chloroflexales bacterium]
MIRLHLFGALRLTIDDRSVTVDSISIAGLLGYLALRATQGRHVTRIHLIEEL